MFQRKYCVSAILVLLLSALPMAAQQAVGDPSATLTSLEQTALSATGDIAHLRIEKWKLDSRSKNDALNDRDSLQRNLKGALPELIGKVRQSPMDLTANFELYRNLEVLSEIFSRFAETTGAFGSRDEYSPLVNDVAGLDAARKALTQRMEALTASAQAELTRYRSQARSVQTPAATQPKKVVIDDSEPKPVAKKKKPAPKAGSTGDAANSSNQPKQ